MNSTRTKNLPLRLLLVAAMAVAVVSASGRAAVALEQWQISAGYDKLLNALGPSVPNGAGVAVSQVEPGDALASYMPDPAFPDFLAAGDPLGQTVTFVNKSNLSNGLSGHATNLVGRFMYGNTSSLTPAVNQVDVFKADDWLDNQVRYTGSSAPVAQPYKVQNHSWIWQTSGNTTNDLAALRRVDYLIETGDVTEVAGANNNDDSNSTGPVDGMPNPFLGHPNMLVHSYNAIVVGRTDGRHSRGVTNSVYGPGRYRPDIVSNAGFTSSATPQVSSAAIVLRQAVAGSAGDRSEPIKAMLLAGATKTEFLPGVVGSPNGPSSALGFVEPSTSVVNNWDRTPTRPLDDIFGAGELNVFNSYLMTVGGQNAGSIAAPASAVKSYGWDYQDKNHAGTGDMFYNFVVPAGSKAKELSVILAWNVNVTDTAAPGFTPQESLQNLDLRLYDSTASFMGAMLDQSISTIDNVEHIYQTNLGPGTYTLKVSGSASWDFGLAWRMSTLFDTADADFDDDGIVSGFDFLTWQQNAGILVGATHAQGDADGDGDVDRDDLIVYDTALASIAAHGNSNGASSSGGASGANGNPNASGVPEPAAITLAALAMGLGALVRRARRGRRTV